MKEFPVTCFAFCVALLALSGWGSSSAQKFVALNFSSFFRFFFFFVYLFLSNNKMAEQKKFEPVYEYVLALICVCHVPCARV